VQERFAIALIIVIATTHLLGGQHGEEGSEVEDEVRREEDRREEDDCEA
jgi:hypothetical protein